MNHGRYLHLLASKDADDTLFQQTLEEPLSLALYSKVSTCKCCEQLRFGLLRQEHTDNFKTFLTLNSVNLSTTDLLE